MANHNTLTSFYFQCGTAENGEKVACWINGGSAHPYPEKLKDEMVGAYEDVFDGGVLDIYIASAEVDSESAPGAVWIHTDEGGDLEQLVLILQHAMDTLPEITSAQGFQWAITCSKPRVDEFGGGACFMVRGKPTEWMQTSGWLAMMIEES